MNAEPSGSLFGAEPRAWLDLPEQTAAITHTGSPLLILAGAGSGKTTVMARRMAHLIREQGWQPEQILGLTFSNKAAANLRARAVSELGPGSNVSVQTYHGFGASIVNANYAHLGFTRLPRLIDRAEAWQLLYGALDTVTIAHRKTGRLGSLINEALALGSSCADHLISIDSVRENCEHLLGPGGPRLAENAKRALQYRLDFCSMVTAYSNAKKSYNCIDFSDQLALAAYAVANLDHVAEDLRKQYPVVLLDEYQDTNYAQRKLLELLYVTPSAEGGPSLANNVTAVGDDMQSIYGFRGAHLSNITNFEQHIPGAVERRLETNHRSGSLVVDIANYVQAQVPSARSKTLRVRSDAPVAKLSSFIGADDSSEASEIAKRCVALGAPWSEIAVLCRKRKVIPAIVSALKAAGVPVEVMGMGGLLARPEVIDLMAWLEIICAPTDEQAVEDEQGVEERATVSGESWIGPDPSIALLRILQGPRFRLGMRDLGALGRSARMLARDRQSDDRRVDLMAALVQTESVTDLSAEAYGRCKQFVHLRSTLRAMLDRSASERSIADVIDAMASEVGLYRDVDTIGYENLLRFIDLAARFTPLSDRAPLAASVAAGDPLYREPPTIRAAMLAFLEYLQLVAESEDDPAEATQTGADAVQIMSIHQAKGLEFDTVFLAGLAGTKKTSSIFPDERLPANGVTQASVLPLWLQADSDRVVPPISNPKELRVLADAARQRANEEELRLLYVAVTRARKNLICSTGHWYPGPATAHGPSAFFDLLQASGFVPLVKSEPAATEDPAVSLRRRRLDSLNETLLKRERAQRDPGSSSSLRSGFDASARGVETGLFGEPLPATAGRTKSRKLKPLAAPLPSDSADGSSSSAPGFAVATLPVSALGVVALCPRKYHWTYVLPLPRRRSSAAEFGTAVHAWIEASNRTAPAPSISGNTQSAPLIDTPPSNHEASRDESLAALEASRERQVQGVNHQQEPSAYTQVRRSGLPVGESTPTGLEAKRSWGPSASTQVQASFLATRFGAMKPALTESSFAFAPNTSPQTVILTGRMDAVYKHADGTIEIVDFKSGRAPTSGPAVPRTDLLDTATSPGAEFSATGFELPVDTALQMAAYGLLALDAWSTPPEQLLTTVCYLGAPEPVLHTTRWNSQLALTQRELVGKQIIKALSGSSGVVPSDTCNYCDFNAFCEGAAQRQAPRNGERAL